MARNYEQLATAERARQAETGRTMDRNKVRINVTITSDSYRTIQERAERSGMDMSEFVRNALRVYLTLLDEQREGKRVYIGTQDKVEKEVLLPS